MFHFPGNRRRPAGTRPRNPLRTRARVEELEPRTLLAAAPLVSVAVPVPSAVARVNPAPATATAVTAPTQALAPAFTVVLTSTATPQGTVLSLTILGVFTSVPPGTNQAAPGASPTATPGSTETAVERLIVLAPRLPVSVALPFAEQFPVQPAANPTPANPPGGAAVNVPPAFNAAAHRLLFVVGGPEDRSAEDYLHPYEDGAVLPSPEEPPLPVFERARPETTAATVEEPRAVAAVSWTWDQVFATEFAAEEGAADTGGLAELPALGAAEAAGPTVTRLEDNEAPAVGPQVLSALAGFGLLNGTRWQKEGPPDGEQPRGRRPRREH